MREAILPRLTSPPSQQRLRLVSASWSPTKPGPGDTTIAFVRRKAGVGLQKSRKTIKITEHEEICILAFSAGKQHSMKHKYYSETLE